MMRCARAGNRLPPPPLPRPHRARPRHEKSPRRNDDR
jgi:hypothetical protein